MRGKRLAVLVLALFGSLVLPARDGLGDPPGDERAKAAPFDVDEAARLIEFSRRYEKASPAVKLAMIETSTSMPENAPIVLEFQELLHQMKTIYKQSDDELVKYTNNLVLGLRQKRMRAYPREILELFTFWAVVEHQPRHDFSEDIAVYGLMRTAVSDRTKSHTHGVMHFMDTMRMLRAEGPGKSSGIMGCRHADDLFPPLERRDSSPAKDSDPFHEKTPLSSPAAETKLRMARGLEKAKKRDAAIRYYKELIEEHPGTQQAEAAAKRLKELGVQP